MQSRSVVVLLTCAWLCSLVAATWGSGTSSSQPKEQPPFRHKDHVLQNWADAATGPEVFRDCRGCHRFDADNLVSSPQKHCESCHYGNGAIELELAEGNEERLDGFASRTRPAFQHHTHGMLECRTCHKLARDRVTGDLRIRTGPGQCATCHEESQARTALDQTIVWFRPAAKDVAIARASGLAEKFTIPETAAELDAYAIRLDQAFAGAGEGINALLAKADPDTGGGDFTHGDHKNLSCKDCHGQIRKAAAADVGTGAIDTKQCGQCHQRAGGEPNPPAEAPVAASRPSWSLGAFAHSDHYGHIQGQKKDGVCIEAAYEPFQGDFDSTCQHCHKNEPERPGYAGRDFPFRGSGPDGEGSKHRYQDCQLCHAVPDWQTGELAEGALHRSSREPAGVEGARESGWVEKRCTECHAFGQPDMKATRPEESVQRWAEKTFVFQGQTHPFITDSLDKDCSECHRAVTRSLPSRLIDKKFRHATHLPPGERGFDNAQCVRCHKGAEQSDASANLAGGDFRTYDINECSKCHLGSEVAEQVVAKEQPPRRSVVAFPHKQHVAHMQCTVCHEVGEEDIVTKPAALLCNDCHKHTSGSPEGLAKLFEIDSPSLARNLEALHHIYDGEAASCANCHHDPETPNQADVPAIRVFPASEAMTADARYNLRVEEFAGFTAAPFHPQGSECAECHKNNTYEVGGKLRIRSIIAKSQQFVFGGIRNGRGSFHVGGTDTDVSQFEKPGERVGCMSCHWKATGSGGKIGGYGEYLPESRGTRADLGNDVAGYPGTKSLGRTGK